MIKIPNISPASKFTQQKATTIRVKDEIKYLYIKTTIKPTTLTTTLNMSHFMEQRMALYPKHN
jgi:hypothetical protein